MITPTSSPTSTTRAELRSSAAAPSADSSITPDTLSNVSVTCALPHHAASTQASLSYSAHLTEHDRQRLQDCLKTMANVTKLEANMSAVRDSIAEVMTNRDKSFTETL
ncbi:hypothetical protein [Stenotrophomonas rhizophila]|uniref:hypothetical protein n=1 Tax=Stenotrophomonas rhizophila TaxID=216778 RepID=UPI0012FD2A63|nr:hypothetical protein [Stenotrophomonas rhizophila]